MKTIKKGSIAREKSKPRPESWACLTLRGQGEEEYPQRRWSEAGGNLSVQDTSEECV